MENTIIFEAKCGESKGRRVLRLKNHFRIEEFTIPEGVLQVGKKYRVMIQEVDAIEERIKVDGVVEYPKDEAFNEEVDSVKRFFSKVLETETVGLFDCNSNEISSDSYKRQKARFVEGIAHSYNMNEIVFPKYDGIDAKVFGVGLFDKEGKLTVINPFDFPRDLQKDDVFSIYEGWISFKKDFS